MTRCWAALLLLSASLVGACGEDVATPKELPTAAQVRDFLGINPGSCVRYVFGPLQYARVSYGGPNSTAVLGRTVYIRSYLTEATTQPDEWYLDSESDAEVSLLRSTEGSGAMRTTRRYEDATTEPLFSRVALDKDKKPSLSVGDRFEVSTTPNECIGNGDCAQGMLEKHTWQVTRENMVSTPDGMELGMELEYRLQRGAGAPITSLYTLVPNKGIAAFTDFSNRRHQVCAWRVCNEAGSCSGPTCDQLNCM